MSKTSEMTVSGYTSRVEYLNARYLLEVECGGSYAEFARRIGRAPQSVNSSLNDRPSRGIGPKTAKVIEDTFKKPRGWLSEVHVFTEGDKTGQAVALPGRTNPQRDLRTNYLTLQRLVSLSAREQSKYRILPDIRIGFTDDISINALIETLSSDYCALDFGHLYCNRAPYGVFLYLVAQGVSRNENGDLLVEPILTGGLEPAINLWARLGSLFKDVSPVQVKTALSVNMAFDVNRVSEHQVFLFNEDEFYEIAQEHYERGAHGPLSIPNIKSRECLYPQAPVVDEPKAHKLLLL